MKKITILIISLFLLVQISTAQQLSLAPTVIASAGGYEEAGNISLSWTLGEVADTTLSAGELLLTQGFQQPYVLIPSVNLNNLIDWNITAFPNPVESELSLQFDMKQVNDFWIEIQDVTGRVISLEQHKEVHPGDILPINMSEFKYGVYFFKIFTPDRQMVRVVSIRKI